MLWMTKPPAKASSANSAESLRTTPARAIQAPARAGPQRLGAVPAWHFDRRRQPREEQPASTSAHQGVAMHHERDRPCTRRRQPRAAAPASARRPPAPPTAVAQTTRPGCTRRRRPCGAGRGRPATGRLLDGQERPDLVAAGADDADGAAAISSRKKLRVEREHDAGEDHQDRADDQHPPPAEAVGPRREPQRDDRVADQGQRQQQADRALLRPSAARYSTRMTDSRP